jgi:hypothetical protein
MRPGFQDAPDYLSLSRGAHCIKFCDQTILEIV